MSGGAFQGASSLRVAFSQESDCDPSPALNSHPDKRHAATFARASASG